MNMRLLYCFFVGLTFLMMSAMPVQAQGREQVAIYGHGNSKCSDYNKFKFENNGNIVKNYQVWVNGFLSAYNTFSAQNGDVGRGLRSDDLMLWLEDFCRLNPETYFQRAMIELLRAMETNQF